jgi:hypothetical protein
LRGWLFSEQTDVWDSIEVRAKPETKFGTRKNPVAMSE